MPATLDDVVAKLDEILVVLPDFELVIFLLQVNAVALGIIWGSMLWFLVSRAFHSKHIG